MSSILGAISDFFLISCLLFALDRARLVCYNSIGEVIVCVCENLCVKIGLRFF